MPARTSICPRCESMADPKLDCAGSASTARPPAGRAGPLSQTRAERPPDTDLTESGAGNLSGLSPKLTELGHPARPEVSVVKQELASGPRHCPR